MPEPTESFKAYLEHLADFDPPLLKRRLRSPNLLPWQGGLFAALFVMTQQNATSTSDLGDLMRDILDKLNDIHEELRNA